MELWLAAFGLVAAVAMIWLARGRHRDDQQSNQAVGDSAEQRASASTSTRGEGEGNVQAGGSNNGGGHG
jgi:hypothetical protein